MTSQESGKKTAVVLAGGGSLGAVQVGMLKALARHGVAADFVVGSSVGAINGAYYAGAPTVEGVAQLEQVWLRMNRDTVFPFSFKSAVLSWLLRRNYAVPSRSLRKVIESALPFSNLEETRLPLHVVATDLLDGQEVGLSSGPAADALLASAAIPGVFPPVEIAGRFLVDGGVANNTPVSTAAALGAGRVIVLSTGFSCAIKEPPRGVVAMAMHALNLLTMRQLVRDARQFEGKIELLIVPPLCPLGITAYDFSHTVELIARAEETTRQWLESGGLESREIPPQMMPHSH